MGQEKVFLHKWPMQNNKLNWLMFASSWEESAIVTTYIINGNPTENQL